MASNRSTKQNQNISSVNITPLVFRNLGNAEYEIYTLPKNLKNDSPLYKLLTR